MVEHGTAAADDWPPAPDRPLLLSASTGHLLAPNANFMSYEGTNTWIVGAPGGGDAVVIDPATGAAEHRAAIRALATSRDWRITQLLLSHTHGDHSEGAADFATELGVPLRGFDAEHGEARLREGEVIELGAVALHVLHTPGHSDDSVSFHLPAEDAVFTGDTVLGGHAGAIFGRVREYFDSLERLRGLVEERPATRFLPGHGPVIEAAMASIERIFASRRRRIEDVRSVVARGVSEVEEIVDVLYPGRTGKSRMPAQMTVTTYLDYLAEEPEDDRSRGRDLDWAADHERDRVDAGTQQV